MTPAHGGVISFFSTLTIGCRNRMAPQPIQYSFPNGQTRADNTITSVDNIRGLLMKAVMAIPQAAEHAGRSGWMGCTRRLMTAPDHPS